MVVDIQGCGVRLFDPENEEKLFCAGNFNSHAIAKFVELHKCNSFCQLVNLSVLH